MSERLLPAALKYIDQVVHCGSIQAAARELNISASAINRQILMLEDELGVELFERLPKGMRPTLAGELVTTLARRWRGELGWISSEIKYLEGENQGHLRIVAMDSMANGVLPHCIGRLRRKHPKITLEIEIATPDAAQSALVNGQADIAVAFNLSPHREVHLMWTTRLPLGCIASPSHPIARAGSVTLQDVAGLPLVLQSRVLTIRRFIEARHDWMFHKGRMPIVTNSLQMLKSLVGGGDYVALTSELDAASEILAGTMVFIPLRDREAEAQTIGIATNARIKLHRAAQIACDAIQADIADLLSDVRMMAKASGHDSHSNI